MPRLSWRRDLHFSVTRCVEKGRMDDDAEEPRAAWNITVDTYPFPC